MASEFLPKPPVRPRQVKTFIDFWLGQQLRGLRKEKGLSLQALAAGCGISVGTLSQVERGLSSASVKTLSQLAQKLDVSVNSLLRNVEKQDGEAGGLVARAKDHRAIVMKDRIEEGVLAGAVLDVFRSEPLPADHPFWGIPAIRITPHVSGATNLKLATAQIAAKLVVYQGGGKPTGIVDRKAGY